MNHTLRSFTLVVALLKAGPSLSFRHLCTVVYSVHSGCRRGAVESVEQILVSWFMDQSKDSDLETNTFIHDIYIYIIYVSYHQGSLGKQSD